MSIHPDLSNHRGLAVWLTGLSGAGKSTLARSVAETLTALGARTEILDADELRKNINRDLGFTKADRNENVRRIAYLASLLTRHQIVVLVAAISPYREARDEARRCIGPFAEVHVDAPLDVCELRDPVGLYRRLRTGQLNHVSGVDEPYEPPLTPELRCHTDQETIQESTDKVVALVLSLI